MADTPMVTIVVVPRERFGVAVESLESIVEHTERPYRLIYVDGGSPKPTADALRGLCAAQGFDYLRYDSYLSPNQARNIGLSRVETPYVAFVDNDVICSPGWLSTMIATAQETGAEVIAPLICQKRPLHTEVHQAGGLIADDLEAFLAAAPEDRRLRDEHVHQRSKVADLALKREETQFCEFHCVLVERALFDRIGPLDEALTATREHLDFSLCVWTNGGRVVFEPKSVVTYLFPSRDTPLQRADWPFFTLRWSPVWILKSLDRFCEKWGITNDPYVEKLRATASWRHTVGLGRSMTAKIPFGRIIAEKAVVLPLLDLWGRRMAAQHARRSAAGPQPSHVSSPSQAA